MVRGIYWTRVGGRGASPDWVRRIVGGLKGVNLEGLSVALAGDGTVVKLASTHFKDRSLGGCDTLQVLPNTFPFLNCETRLRV